MKYIVNELVLVGIGCCSPEACAAILWKTAAAAPLVGFTHQI
jgi:acetyl-CoA carboxylase alpha subunit